LGEDHEGGLQPHLKKCPVQFRTFS
jgi:hypothetical protein